MVRLERLHNRGYLSYEETFQLSVSDITGRDKQELVWFIGEQKRVNEVRVFSDYYSEIPGRQVVDRLVRRAITIG